MPWQQEITKRYSKMGLAHQGQKPEKASVVVLGLDANWSPGLANHPDVCNLIFEYLDDGVAFWGKYGYHHPFLLEQYQATGLRDGVRYHRMFTKLGLTKCHAPHVSFAELLNVPTSGRVNETDFLAHFEKESVREHATRLEAFLMNGERRLVSVCDGVARRMNRLSRRHNLFTKVMKHLPEEGAYFNKPNVPTYSNGKTEFILARHFSAVWTIEGLEALGRRFRKFIDGPT